MLDLALSDSNDRTGGAYLRPDGIVVVSAALLVPRSRPGSDLPKTSFRHSPATALTLGSRVLIPLLFRTELASVREAATPFLRRHAASFATRRTEALIAPSVPWAAASVSSLLLSPRCWFWDAVLPTDRPLLFVGLRPTKPPSLLRTAAELVARAAVPPHPPMATATHNNITKPSTPCGRLNCQVNKPCSMLSASD